MTNTQKMPRPIGKWKDTYVYRDGRVIEHEWKSNQIQDTQATLCAILMKGTRDGEISSFSGIEWFAVGEGDPSWDLSPPAKDQAQTTLESELWRSDVDSGTQVFYLDPDTEAISGTPTRMLQFNLVIPFDVVGDLREFGMFGGNATVAADSGYMVNWISHDLTEKDSTFQILRTLRIKWLIVGE